MIGKHTKTPWSAPEGMGFAGGCPYTGIDSPEGAVAWVLCSSRIPVTGEDRENPWEANAALIVRAVNSHDALVRALEEIAEGAGPFSRDPLTHAENCIDDMKERARAALALARGETT